MSGWGKYYPILIPSTGYNRKKERSKRIKSSAKTGKLLAFCLIAALLLTGSVPAFSEASQVTGTDGMNPGSQKRTDYSYTEEDLRAIIPGISIPFIENRGQTDDDILFYSGNSGGMVAVTQNNEIIYRFSGTETRFTETFTGMDDSAFPQGLDETPARISCFRSSSEDGWKSDLHSYERIGLGEVYRGITVELRKNGAGTEKVFTVAPGGEPSDIMINIDGGSPVITAQGELRVGGASGALYFTAPVAWQNINGRQVFIPVSYRLFSGRENTYGFFIGEYDNTRELMIDPLHHSTYIGGTDEEQILAITLDGQNNVYIAGYTESWNFPFLNGYSDDYQGGTDIFIAKLSRDLSTLLAATFIGGSEDEEPAKKFILDAEGNVILSGWTGSADFPVTAGAYDTEYNGGEKDGFILKLNPNLSQLIASTYYGGGAGDEAAGVTAAENGDVYITGTTASTDLPMNISPVAIPANDTAVGYYTEPLTVSLSHEEGALIRYTTDGSVPDSDSAAYSGGISVEEDTIVMATAVKNSMEGPIGVFDYRMSVSESVYAPSADVPSGYFDNPFSVTLETLSQDADIYYTLDGSLPTSGSNLYHAPIPVNQDTLVLTVAIDKMGNESLVSGFHYKQEKVGYQTEMVALSDGFIAAFSPDLGGLKTATYFGSEHYENSSWAINIYHNRVYAAGMVQLKIKYSYPDHVGVISFDMSLSEQPGSNFFRGTVSNRGGYVESIYDVCFADDGSIYLSYLAWLGNWYFPIVKISPELELLGELKSHRAMDPGSLGVTNGNLYYGGTTSWDYNNYQIRYFTADLDGVMSDFETYHEGLPGGRFAAIPNIKSLRAIAFDSDGNVYIAGQTDSEEFPVSDNAFQRFNLGGADGFIAVLAQDLQKQAEADLTLTLDMEKIVLPGGGPGVRVPVQVANLGPDNANGARVELTFTPLMAVQGITAEAPEGDEIVIDGNTLVWLLKSNINLVESPGATLTVAVKEDFHGEIEVQGTVRPEGASDPDDGNSEASAVREVNPLADILAELINNRTESGNWEQRIIVENLGPTGAENIRISYRLPSTQEFLQALPSGYLFDGETNTIRWNLPYLNTGLRLEDTYLVESGLKEGGDPDAVMEGTVKAESDTPDPNPDNNESSLLFGGSYNAAFLLEYSDTGVFYLNTLSPWADIFNSGSQPFRPEIILSLPSGIEVAEELKVFTGSSEEPVGSFTQSGDRYRWLGSFMLESMERLYIRGKYRVTEWNQEQNYQFNTSAVLKGYDAEGRLQLVKTVNCNENIIRPDLGFEDREQTCTMAYDQQKQFEMEVCTSVSKTKAFNTRGRAKVTLEIIDGMHDQIQITGITHRGNTGDPEPVKINENTWEWLLPEGLDKIRDTKKITIQAGPFREGESVEDLLIRLQVSYEPGAFDYSEHEEVTANDTGSIRVHFKELKIPTPSLKTNVDFHYNEKTKTVLQTYTTVYHFKNGENISDFFIDEKYAYLNIFSDFKVTARPALNTGNHFTGNDFNEIHYAIPQYPYTKPYQMGIYVTTVETPGHLFPFGENLVLNTRVKTEYETDENGATEVLEKDFVQTFCFPVPPPRISTPVTGEMFVKNMGIPVAGWAIPNAEIRLRRAGDDQLLATTTSDANGAFFTTIAATGGSDSLGFYAAAVSVGAGEDGIPSETVMLTKPQHCWDPQRSVWEGCDNKGKLYHFNFRSRITGRPSTTHWKIPGAMGFVDSTLKLYTRITDPEEVWVISDGVRYDPSEHNGHYFTFYIESAHDVLIHVKCDNECEEPAESTGIVLIDPDGFVYNSSLGWGNVVSGAKVTCMEYLPATESWREWPAHLDIYENQVNPQVVGDDGYFAFFTPAGRYHIRVENPAPYQSWRSEDLFVVTEIVHRNVPYTPLPTGEPAVTVYASSAGLADEEGQNLTEVTIDMGEIVQWVSKASAGASLDDLLQLTVNPVIRIESLINPETGRLGFDSGMLAPLDTYRRRFLSPGVYEYFYLRGDTEKKGRIVVRSADPEDDESSESDRGDTTTLTPAPDHPPAITPGFIAFEELKILEENTEYVRVMIPDDLLRAQTDAGQEKLEIHMKGIDHKILFEFGTDQQTLISEKLSEIKLLTEYGQLTIPAVSFPQGEKLELSLGRFSREAVLPAGARHVTQAMEFTASKNFRQPANIRLNYETGDIGTDEEIFVFTTGSMWKPLSIAPKDGALELETAKSIPYLLAAVNIGFKDITGHWARRDIASLSIRGIVNGISKGKFEPDRMITRAEFAAVLVRALGLESVKEENPFSDIRDTDWYYKPVQAAYENGLINGYGSGKFGPMDKITREQAITILVRTTDVTGIKIKPETDKTDKILSAFSDYAQASPWAKDSLAACIKAGLLIGTDDKRLAPVDEATRAEMIVLIGRWLERTVCHASGD